MGGCSFSGKTSTKSDSVIRTSNNQSPTNQRNQQNLIRPENSQYPNRPFNQRNTAHGINNNQEQSNNNYTKQSNKFQDMEEYEDIYIGEGIKKIKAYKSNLLYDQIDKLREEFYASKKEKKDCWITIKQACIADAATAEILLATMNMMCLGDNMRCIVETNSGYLFNIPNFCINYPLIMKETHDISKIEEQFFKKVTLIDVFNNQKHYNFENISNKLMGKDLKNMYFKIANKSCDEFNVRLIFKGEEIKNDDVLAKFNFENLNKIQVSCNKKCD